MNFKEEIQKRNQARENRIKIEDLQDRKLYRLLARNIKIGVWEAVSQQFLGIRTKFDSRFIDGEYHWDAPAYATACPLEVIGQLPDDISFDNRQKLFNWLEEQEAILSKEI